jgi:KipI family sensor histidine kinase inhibitor
VVDDPAGRPGPGEAGSPEIVRLVAAGDAAMIAEFDERIDPALNARVVSMADALARELLPGVRDVVPTFRSVTVYFDPLTTDVSGLSRRLRDLAISVNTPVTSSGALIEIPVCYGGELGPDLHDVARFAGISPDEVVTRHVSPIYRAFMIGFLPGFAYLGVVDGRIAAPRRGAPRISVAAGSVGIAGAQTGVYPRVSPGGWNIVGRTPLVMFDPDGDRRSRVMPGDMVRFQAVTRSEFDRLRGAGMSTS